MSGHARAMNVGAHDCTLSNVVTCVHSNVGVVTVRAQTCVVTCLYSNVSVVTCTYSNESVVVCAQIKRGRRPVCALKRECYHGCNGRWATASAGAEMFVLCIVELGERTLLIKCDNRSLSSLSFSAGHFI